MNKKGISTEILAYIIIGVIVLGLVYWGMSSAFGNSGILGAFKNILPGFPGIKEPSNFGEDNIVVDATGEKIRYSTIYDKVYSRQATSWNEVNNPELLKSFQAYWYTLRQPAEFEFVLGGEKLTANVLRYGFDTLDINGNKFESYLIFTVKRGNVETQFILPSEEFNLFTYDEKENEYVWVNGDETSSKNYADLIANAKAWKIKRLAEPVLFADKKYCPENSLDYYDQQKSIIIDLTKPFEGENCYE